MKINEFYSLSIEEKYKFFEDKQTSNHKNNIVLGVGVNDLPHTVSVVIDGKVVRYPPYTIWKDMMNRCYSNAVHIRLPKYKGCDVSKEWWYLSKFSIWCKENFVDGYQLDKDILVFGNKTYSKDTCIFVPNWVNSFVLPRTKQDLPAGVSFHKRDKRYNVNYSLDGNTIYIGSCGDKVTASKMWIEKKISILNERKCELDNIDLRLYHRLKFNVENI